MRIPARVSLSASAVAAAGLLFAEPIAAQEIPDEAFSSASCMGSGSSFYGTFAPEQRAFVALYVVDLAETTGSTPGDTYVYFAQEKEGGTIPTPCGTRIE